MRRFEYKDNRSYKFWEIKVEGNAYTVRYGKVGAKGSTSTKSFATPEKAAADAEKKIRSKVGKGYAEVALESAAPAQSASSVSDWSVHADQLQAAGDPWGERISVFMQWEEAKGAGKRKFKKRLDELDAAHGEHFYGKALASLLSDKSEFEGVARLKWKHGYIDEARLRVGYGHKGPSVEDVLAALVAAPASKHMKKLVLGRIADHSDDYGTCMTILGRGGLDELEYLFVGDFSYPDDTEISWVTIGDLGAALPGLPALQTLRARGGGVRMSNFEHAKLRRLEVESGGLPGAGLRGFAEAKLPELVHVSLWLGTDDYGGSTEIGDLQALWSNPNLAKLSHLGLQNSIMQDEVAKAVAESKILEQLSSVDLSMGTMRDPGARALLANVDRFKHLKSLNLDDNFIPWSHREGLRNALGDTLQWGGQRSPEDWGDDELHYYTAVAE